jgi:hypothetical protein
MIIDAAVSDCIDVEPVAISRPLDVSSNQLASTKTLEFLKKR